MTMSEERNKLFSNSFFTQLNTSNPLPGYPSEGEGYMLKQHDKEKLFCNWLDPSDYNVDDNVLCTMFLILTRQRQLFLYFIEGTSRPGVSSALNVLFHVSCAYSALYIVIDNREIIPYLEKRQEKRTKTTKYLKKKKHRCSSLVTIKARQC